MAAQPPPVTAAPSVLGTGTLVRYAVGSIGTGGFSTLPGLVLVYFLTDTLGVAAIAAGLLVTLAKVWDVVIDPFIGARSDRSLARTGSRRRFMLLGAVLLPLFFAITFAVPAGLPPVLSGVWVFVAFVLAATAFSLFQVPYIALPAELASGYDARTRLLSARVVVLTFAILLFGAGGPALRSLGGGDEHLGYLLMGVVAALVLFAGLIVSMTAARRGEPFEEAHASVAESYRRGWEALRRSAPFRALLGTFVLQALATGMMLAGAQYVARWVLHDENAVDLLFVALIAPALVCAPLWGLLARRTGKERAFAFASVLFGLAALSLVVLAFAPGAWLYASVAVAGAAYAGLQTLPLAMLPDVIGHDARRHGENRAGTFGGVWTAGETAGLALGTTVLTIVLAVTGYQASLAGEHTTQSATAVLGIVLSFSIVPAVIVALSLLTLARYPLRRADVDAGAATPDAADDALEIGPLA
jgi:Na+/melibiose symporter-like transporter